MKTLTQKQIQLVFNNNEVDVIATFELKRKLIVLDYFRKGKMFFESQIMMPNNKVGSEFIKGLDSKTALDIIKYNYEII
jgi:hypothetical protein